jgi:membrane associated rhomboid family serine protease
VQFSYRIALIPDALQGRVNSSFRLFAFLLTPVGAAACGWLLEHGGTASAVAVFGAVCALLAVAVRLDPAVRNAAGRAARAAAPPAGRRLQAQPVQRLHRPAARPAPAATGARPAAAGHRLP